MPTLAGGEGVGLDARHRNFYCHPVPFFIRTVLSQLGHPAARIKRTSRPAGVLVRDLSGNATYQELTAKGDDGVSSGNQQ